MRVTQRVRLSSFCRTLIELGLISGCLLGFASASGKSRNFHEAIFSDAQDPQSTPPQRSDPSSDDRPLITLPSGSVIEVRVADNVDSKHAQAGELLTGTVDPSVLIHDAVVIPRGTEAHIRVSYAKKGGHIKGKAEMTLELISLVMNGQRLEVDTDEKTKSQGAAGAKGEAVKKRAASGGTSSVPGEPLTAAAGPVIAVFSAAKVEVKAGSRIEFHLEKPFTFERPPANGPQS